MSDERAKDVLDSLPSRRRAGDLTHDKVGRRRTEGPGGERRRRLFDRLGVADPYNPDAKEKPLELGPVALKLTGKRQPAPHLKVRDPRKPKSTSQNPASFRPNVPASKPKPKPPPKPTAPPKPPPSQAAKPPPGPAGAPRLPVRPDLAGDTPTAAPKRPPVPTRPAHKTQDKSGGRRFRLQRTAATGPKERKVEKNKPLVEKTEEVAATPQPKAGPAGNNMGLDDLFGFSGEGRMRRSKKDDE